MTSTKQRFLLAFGVFVIVAGALGFGAKLLEMIMTAVRGREHAFTAPPVVGYLFVAGGYLFLLGAATLQGMFRNVERPKYRMLELEEEINEAEDRARLLGI